MLEKNGRHHQATNARRNERMDVFLMVNERDLQYKGAGWWWCRRTCSLYCTSTEYSNGGDAPTISSLRSDLPVPHLCRVQAVCDGGLNGSVLQQSNGRDPPNNNTLPVSQMKELVLGDYKHLSVIRQSTETALAFTSKLNRDNITADHNGADEHILLDRGLERRCQYLLRVQSQYLLRVQTTDHTRRFFFIDFRQL
jgi:hypothetical protein